MKFFKKYWFLGSISVVFMSLGLHGFGVSDEVIASSYAVILSVLIIVHIALAWSKWTNEDSESPKFAGRAVSIILFEGVEVHGRMLHEPNSHDEHVYLKDAQIIDRGGIPDENIRDVLAIPKDNIQMVGTVDLDKV